MIVKIVNSNEVWRKPDGSLVLYEVDFLFDGKVYRAKTWSKTIGEAVGKEIDVESEKKEREGKKEIFIKQVKKGKYSPGRQELDKRIAALQVAAQMEIARFKVMPQHGIEVGKMLNEADKIYQWLNK